MTATEDTLQEDLRELRESEDPRAHPEFPYPSGWEHLADEWPEETDRLETYVVLWKETRGPALYLVECRGRVPDLVTARKWAQEMSVRQSTSGQVAWVQFQPADLSADPETVDVWTSGFWLPPSHWTKGGPPQNAR